MNKKHLIEAFNGNYLGFRCQYGGGNDYVLLGSTLHPMSSFEHTNHTNLFQVPGYIGSKGSVYNNM